MKQKNIDEKSSLEENNRRNHSKWLFHAIELNFKND